MPIDKETLQAITKSKNVRNVTNECPRCGQFFNNEQGLGSHILNCKEEEFLSSPPDSNTVASPTSFSLGSHPSSVCCDTPVKEDKRCLNRGSSKQRRYTMKEKYEIIELCDEAIARDLHPNIKNPSQYFHYYYCNHDVAHKWVAQYGK